MKALKTYEEFNKSIKNDFDGYDSRSYECKFCSV